jgi:hypothetical protein
MKSQQIKACAVGWPVLLLAASRGAWFAGFDTAD